MTDAVANLAAAGASLGAVAAATAADPATNPNAFSFKIAHTDTEENKEGTLLGIDQSLIATEILTDFVRKAIRDYVNNSVNQAQRRANEANKAWDAYDAAIAVDAMQTAVPKPEKPRETADLIETAKAARERLYKGEVRKQSTGEGKSRAPKDPLIAAITQVVVREVFDKNKATTPGYKWPQAIKEVGADGLAYLKARVEALVTAGQDRATLEKFLDEKYVKPAQMMIGAKTNKATEGTSLL